MIAIACRSYDELVDVLRARRLELGLKQLAVDDLAGNQSGYQGKVECKDRRLGPISGPAILGALSLELHVRGADTPTGLELLVGLKPAKEPIARGRTHVDPALGRTLALPKPGAPVGSCGPVLHLPKPEGTTR
jgi:hypothetical protein